MRRKTVTTKWMLVLFCGAEDFISGIFVCHNVLRRCNETVFYSFANWSLRPWIHGSITRHASSRFHGEIRALVLTLMLSRSSFKHVFKQTILLSLHRVLNKQMFKSIWWKAKKYLLSNPSYEQQKQNGMLSSYYQGASLKLTYSSNETWKLDVASYLELSSISKFPRPGSQVCCNAYMDAPSGSSDTLNLLASLVRLC